MPSSQTAATAVTDAAVPSTADEQRKGPRTSAPRGEYRKSKRTRAAILQASLEVFAESGYHKGSLRQIADRVGMSEAGMLHHFPSKRALLLAALEYRDDESRAIVGPSAVGRDLLRGLVEVARDSASKPGVVRIYSTVSAEATASDHPAHTYFVRRYREVGRSIEEALELVGRQGGLRPGVDPHRAAIALLALWDGLQVQWLLHGDLDLPTMLEHQLDGYLTEPLRAA